MLEDQLSPGTKNARSPHAFLSDFSFTTSLRGVLFAATLGLGALLAAGCSGAETQDVLAQTASSSGTTSTSGSTGTSGGTSGTTSGGTTSGASGGTSGTASGCVQEEEPNDDSAQANVLSPARCGTLDGGGDIDVLSFTLRPTTKELSLNFTGRIKMLVTIEGAEKVVYELSAERQDAVPFQRDGRYFVEVQRNRGAGDAVAWRVEVVEK